MSDIKAAVTLSLKDQFSNGIDKAGDRLKGFASAAKTALDGVDKAFSGVTGAIGAMGVSIGVGAAVKEFVSFEDRLVRVGLTADASAEQLTALKQSIYEAATSPEIKVDTSSILDALDVVMTKTGDLAYSEENIRNIAVAIKATGESGDAIGSVFAEFAKFGYTAEQITSLMDDMVKQGDQGAFTFAEFAKQAPAVLAAYSQIGTTPEHVRKANAAMQILTAGSKNADMAVTTLNATMNQLTDPKIREKIEMMGVTVRDKATGSLRDFNDIIGDIAHVVRDQFEGNTEVLKQIGLSDEAKKSVAAYINFYDKMYDGLTNLGDTEGALLAKSAKAAQTLSSNFQNLQTSFYKFADANLTKPLGDLADILNKLAESPENIERAFTAVAVGVGAIAAMKGLNSVINLIGGIKDLSGGGSIGISTSGLGGNGMPVYVTNWGGKAGASPFSAQPATGMPTSTGAKPLQAASAAASSVTGAQLAAGGVTAGLGAAMVAIPNMVSELSQIKSNAELTDAERSRAKGGAIGAGAGTVIGAVGGGIGGVAAGAAAGAAIGSVVPGLGTAVGAIVGAGIGALGGWLGGKAGRAIGEGIGGAVAKDEIALAEATEQVQSLAPLTELPATVIDGTATFNVNLDITGDRPKATVSVENNNMPSWVRFNAGSVDEAREY